MATWKKLLHEDSSIPTSQLADVNGISKGQIIVGTADDTVDVYDVPSGRFLVGNSSGEARTAILSGGDIGNAVVSDESGILSNLSLTINDDAVTETKIADNQVTIGKIAPSGGSYAGIAVFGDGTAADEPTILQAGESDAGKTIKVNADGDGWEFTTIGSAATVDLADDDLTRTALIIGGGISTGADNGVTLRRDAELSYDSNVGAASVNHKGGVTGITSTDVSYFDMAAGTETANLHVGGGWVRAHVNGVAAGATQIMAEKAGTSGAYDQFFGVPFIGKSNEGGLPTSDDWVGVAFQNSFLYNPAEQTLKVKNLIVEGTNSIIETTFMAVEDKTIRVGAGEAASATTSNNLNSGLVVNIGDYLATSGNEDTITQDNPDGTLPRIIWTNGSNTTAGWAIANKGPGTDTDLTASTARGIAVLEHTTASVTQATLNSSYTDYGIGSFFLSDSDGPSPELYIKVA